MYKAKKNGNITATHCTCVVRQNTILDLRTNFHHIHVSQSLEFTECL